MKVKVGQIWYLYQEPDRQYRITSIDKDFDNYYYVVKADLINDNGEIVQANIGFGHLNPDGSPRWGTSWLVKYPPGSFSRVSAKSLRKRMRDQMAGEVLAHRLTEPTVKPKLRADWRMVADYAINDALRTDMLYYQQRLIESLNLPSNWFHDP